MSKELKKLEELLANDRKIIEENYKEIERLHSIIKEVREYINEYAWQEDVIGGEYTTTGKPVKDRYMRLEWDNCNELLEILDKEK